MPALGRVMLVDDTAIDLMLYKRVLEKSGEAGEVISFQMAEDALASLRGASTDGVDAIFLDINMPRMNGIEFLAQATREFGDRFCNGVFVMMTTPLMARDQAALEAFPMVLDFIAKPLRSEHLRRSADLLTASTSLRQALDAASGAGFAPEPHAMPYATARPSTL